MFGRRSCYGFVPVVRLVLIYMNKPVFLIVGVGEATGQSLARRVAGDYQLVLVARSAGLIDRLAEELPGTLACTGDISNRQQWPALLGRIVEEVGVPARILINTESAAWGEYNELDIEQFAGSFDVNATGLLQTIQTLFPDKSRIAADTRVMVSSSPAAYNPPRHFLGLAPSRVAQRVIAELLDETLSVNGLEFSVFSIDGAIDEPKMRAMLPDKPTSYFIAPDDIADEMVAVFDREEFPIASGISGESSFAKR